MADLRSRRTEPTSLRHAPTPAPPQPREPRPRRRAARPQPPAPAPADSTGSSSAFRTLQWVALFAIVLAAIWLMFGTPARHQNAGVAEAAWSSDSPTQ